MTRADNTRHLLQAAARRHQRAITQTRAAIETLDRSGQAITFTAVAHAAGVSRGWLYGQTDLRAAIIELRDRTTTTPVPSAQRASGASLRQRLDSQKDEIAALRADNHALREQLARQLGELRTRS
jgi:hypothetical protein